MKKSMQRRSLALLLGAALVAFPVSSFATIADPDAGTASPASAPESAGSDAMSPGMTAEGTDGGLGSDTGPATPYDDCGMTDPCTPGMY